MTRVLRSNSTTRRRGASRTVRIEPPAQLVSAILNGRCVAFVGAGFSAMVTPTWTKLLERIAQKLNVPFTRPSKGNALLHEAVGQQLRDRAGKHWERLVYEVLEEHRRRAGAASKKALTRRCERLLSIPFKAILTTNFDLSLGSTCDELGPSVYSEVLREERPRWWKAPSSPGQEERRTPLIKLHGEANGHSMKLPLVFGRVDYRHRIYKDRNYASFVRSVFAEYTILFLGVSFTDAYLNELRSEVLQLVHRPRSKIPWGYAIVNQPLPMFRTFLQDVEGINVLPTKRHGQFDRWLKAIADRTSVAGRLKQLLPNRRIVWVDPHHAQNNEEGLRLLGEAAKVKALGSYKKLKESAHGSADVILTNFGHEEGLAFSLLERIRTWRSRPPVIVFSSPAPRRLLIKNRRECLRRGAWEYTTQWDELYRAIELALSRVPGTADSY